MEVTTMHDDSFSSSEFQPRPLTTSDHYDRKLAELDDEAYYWSDVAKGRESMPGHSSTSDAWARHGKATAARDAFVKANRNLSSGQFGG
jgi:hypothetical protein